MRAAGAWWSKRASYSPFIYALDQRNIAITGGGILDGQANAEHWWPWGGKRGAKPDDPNQRKARAAPTQLMYPPTVL